MKYNQLIWYSYESDIYNYVKIVEARFPFYFLPFNFILLTLSLLQT